MPKAMKFLLFFVMVVLSISTYGQQIILEGKFKVDNIDSISYYYLIRATNIEKPQKRVIIVSEKIGCKEVTLVEGEVYSLSLASISKLRVGERKEDVILLPHRNFSIDEKMVCVNGELPYLARNLKGLCYSEPKP